MQQHRRRIEDRHKVMVRARLRAKGAEGEACILDISTRGLSATAAAPPARGEFIELTVGDHSIVGQVKWSGERRFGVAFRQRISVIAAISGKGDLALPGNRPVAQAVAQRRAGQNSVATGRNLEFLIFAVAGVLATLLVVNYATSALASLDTARLALAGSHVSG